MRSINTMKSMTDIGSHRSTEIGSGALHSAWARGQVLRMSSDLIQILAFTTKAAQKAWKLLNNKEYKK